MRLRIRLHRNNDPDLLLLAGTVHGDRGRLQGIFRDALRSYIRADGSRPAFPELDFYTTEAFPKFYDFEMSVSDPDVTELLSRIRPKSRNAFIKAVVRNYAGTELFHAFANDMETYHAMKDLSVPQTRTPLRGMPRAMGVSPFVTLPPARTGQKVQVQAQPRMVSVPAENVKTHVPPVDPPVREEGVIPESREVPETVGNPAESPKDIPMPETAPEIRARVVTEPAGVSTDVPISAEPAEPTENAVTEKDFALLDMFSNLIGS